MRAVLPVLVILGVVVIAPARAAEAAPSDVAGIDSLLEAAAVTTDATPTIVFAIADATGSHGTAYGYSELAYNTVAGAVYTHVLLVAADDYDTPTIAALAAADVVHNALVAHGIATVAERRAWPASTTTVVAGSLLSTELFGPPSDPNDETTPPMSRPMAIASVAINSPLAYGYTYRAVRDFQSGHNALGALNITGAVVATSFAVNAITDTSRPRLHGVAPTVVDDGHGDIALGLGVHGRLR
jgi:hypothetical protein